jgi:glyoxylase-like metal-dependent hydrolase (beta-lactamase superfamily II)
MRFLTAIVLAAVCCAADAQAAGIVRYVSDEKGFAVNSWLVPTATGLVVIDTQFTVSEAEKLAQAVVATGRPLSAIIVTHPHPDHFNGVCRLLQIARVPVYATRATIAGIHATADAKRAQWKPSYGSDYPDRTCEPDAVVESNAEIRIDGTMFQFQDFGPGEASDESIIVVPSLNAAFVGDLIYRNMHPWLAEGRSDLWLAQLDRLQTAIPQGATIYPGHGTAAGAAVIDDQRRYIEDFRRAVKSAIGPNGLSRAASETLTAKTRASYPGWSLEMLIPINADAVAKELAPKIPNH